jgi:hypothetical protein
VTLSVRPIGPRSRAPVIATVLAIAWLGAVAAACQVIGGIDRVAKEDPPPPSGDAAVDAAPPAPPADPCAHARPAPKPETDDAPLDPDQLPPFLLAVETLNLIPTDAAGAVRGLDLDGVCTCDPRPFTFGDGGAACQPRAGGVVACDLDGGADNQGGLLFRQYDALLDINAAAGIDDEIRAGRQTLLVTLVGYNGRANDREVDVGLMLSQGIAAEPPQTPGCASTFDASSGRWSATFCGSDPWTIVKTSALGTNHPPVPIRTGRGWVNDYELVVSIGGGDVPVPFGSLVVDVAQASLTGKLVPLGEDLAPRDPSVPPKPTEQRLYRLDGALVVGRLPASELLAVVGTFTEPGSGGARRICEDQAYFDPIKGEICKQLDIARTSERDLDQSVACDAISFAAAFDAFPALDGDYVDPKESPNVCRPAPDGGAPDAAAPGVSYACP